MMNFGGIVLRAEMESDNKLGIYNVDLSTHPETSISDDTHGPSWLA